MVEFLALPLMALWPLKKKVKSWIYAPEAKSSRLRLLVAALWLVAFIEIGATYLPHCFFG